MAKSDRNSSIEVFRIFLMLVVIVLHVSNRYNPWPTTSSVEHATSFCVPGFAVVSGWFGVKFNLSKVIRLIGVLFYAIVVTEVLRVFVMGGGLDVKSLLAEISGFWFLWAYVGFLMFAPVVNSSLSAGSRRQKLSIVIPLLTATLIWGWCSVCWPVCRVVPNSKGIGPYSLLMLVGVYVATKCVRRFEKQLVNVPLSWLIGVSLLMEAFIIVFHLGNYCSPFVFVLTIALFVIFLRLRFPRLLSFPAKSVFAVYLLHLTPFGFYAMDWIHSNVAHVFSSVPVVQLLTAVSVFVFSVALDLPRRGICHLMDPPIKRGFIWIDTRYENLIARLSKIKGENYEDRCRDSDI